MTSMEASRSYSLHSAVGPTLNLQMASNIAACPKILVLRWNASHVYVRCPYCEGIHRHGTALPGRRTSHCRPSGEYEFVFPIDRDKNLVAYEVDKRKACFATVDSQTGEGLSSGIDERAFADHFRSAMSISTTKPRLGPEPSLYEDSSEMETMHFAPDDIFQHKRILLAVSDCINGDLHAITRYLDTSVETDIFLHGKNQAGNTTLIMAAAEANNEMPLLLLKRGADPNATNNEGRSPLMEASLWGRLESVKALLNCEADKNLRDHEGYCALDLAQPGRRNERERYQRSSQAAAKDTPERDQDRRHIVVALGDLSSPQTYGYSAPLSVGEREKYSFRKSKPDLMITLCGPIASYHVRNISKTAAVLDRGDPFPRISATSGWGADSLPSNERDGPSWINRVYDIASAIGHEFQDAPDSTWDQGRLGQYFASHAEKKLIAYFLDRHVFMPSDRELDQELEKSILEAEEMLEEKEEEYASEAWGRVCALETSKETLNLELFDADDLLLGDDYDAQEVKRLKDDITAIDAELLNLYSNTTVARLKFSIKTKHTLLEQRKKHEDLRELSMNEPSISLRRAVILSSNKVCTDCALFKRRTNDYFQLGIEMNWCV